MPRMAFFIRLFLGLLLLGPVPLITPSAAISANFQESLQTWPMLLGGPDRNGSATAMGPSGTNLSVTPIIRTKAAIASSPAVAEGILYFGSDEGYLWAVEAASGRVLWQFATGGLTTSSPAIDLANDIVYVGTVKGLLAVNRLDGTLRWLLEVTNGVATSPAVFEEFVFYAGGDGGLAFYDKDKNAQGSVTISTSTYSSPAVFNNFIFVGAADGLHVLMRPEGGNVTAFNELTVVPTDSPVDGIPVVSGDRVYFVSASGTVAAVDLNLIATASTPVMCWSYSFESPVSLTPAVVGKSVLVVDGLQLRRLSTPNDACSLAALAETVAEFAPSTSQSLLPGSAGAAMVLAGNGLFLGIGV